MFFPKHLFLVKYPLHTAHSLHAEADCGFILYVWKESHSNAICNFVLCAWHLLR